MSWDKRMAVNYAKTHAGSHSQGRCAEFTRKAIQAGGITLGHTYHAKDYGPMLRSAGFTAIGTYEMPREGDVIIIQPYAGGNPSGHMAIYDGAEWYSRS
ncbi:NlpC/P60 family protein, partial [Salmonella enterica]|uniref:NlpC/P60 family protein n=1 Tax=Salmonella enterica TaxID=28901 RepID=UPI0011161ED1